MNNDSNMSHGLGMYSVKSRDPEFLKSSHRIDLLRKLDSEIRICPPVTNGPERYVKLSLETDLHCQIDWFVLIPN